MALAPAQLPDEPVEPPPVEPPPVEAPEDAVLLEDVELLLLDEDDELSLDDEPPLELAGLW